MWLYLSYLFEYNDESKLSQLVYTYWFVCMRWIMNNLLEYFQMRTLSRTIQEPHFCFAFFFSVFNNLICQCMCIKKFDYKREWIGFSVLVLWSALLRGWKNYTYSCDPSCEKEKIICGRTLWFVVFLNVLRATRLKITWVTSILHGSRFSIPRRYIRISYRTRFLFYILSIRNIPSNSFSIAWRNIRTDQIHNTMTQNMMLSKTTFYWISRTVQKTVFEVSRRVIRSNLKISYFSERGKIYRTTNEVFGIHFGWPTEHKIACKLHRKQSRKEN